ncbi:aminoglycoside phosphotransferase family protein [Leptospira interrogans]|uniref:Aminoglycoside phosphotransferase family protein n=6 Tax=Leptospira interrogans TaxID=173 RepID=A0AAQ0AZ51_LEPIR|nr:MULTISPECIES: aminoglycoside phosphotransferase family protein [Leptospira]EMG11781.1 phosphotransferase enzyme family protein [Leptospira interrogans serovar Grippotyphosa str. LT2186]EMM95616.1 phosphotransferase enzyme family protein [Leptospira interrogans serovar Zanoni str. LT2156]EMN29014.1 phosphotransferase enzyme family protein [Leptospira interrogans serovar Pyrogenes str. L0374]ALE41142.1 Ser/Thr protein kinase-like phosphotransferase [Leptospira interrogans serovar Hardjo str. N
MNISIPLTDPELKFLEFSGKLPQEITPIVSEASDRKYFRVVYPDRTLILCKDLRFQHDFVEIADFLSHEQFLVPEILKKDLIHFLILMTDGGEKDLTSIEDDLEYRDWLIKSIEILVKLQKTNPIPPVSSRDFDLEKLDFESNFTYSNYLKFKKEFQLKTQLRSETKIFIEECSAFLAEYPVKVFCHRDFHGRNLLINSQNQICMIDFQDARMGTPFYDLASILYDAYRPIPFGMRQGLYQIFLNLSEQNFPKSKECYYIQCLQRSYKALGSYFYLIADKKMNKYKQSVLNALDNLLEIVQVGLFPDQLYVFFHLLKEELLSDSNFMKGIG